MAYLGSWKIDDYVTFACNTHDPDTGVATDADSVPAYRIYEDETGTAILTGTMAKLDDANTTGFYSERIQLTAASGFEKGKCYTVYISATVDSDTGTMHHTLQIEAEVDANTVGDKTGYGLADSAITAAKIATDAITAAKIATDAITAAKIATNAITAAKVATDAITEITDGVRDKVMEGSLTLQHVLRIILAVIAEKSAGGGTASITFRDNADAKNRVTATVDANGNRTAVTLDGS